MILSNRTLASLSQIVSIQNNSLIRLLLEKYQLNSEDYYYEYFNSHDIFHLISQSNEEKIKELIVEFFITEDDLRCRQQPRRIYDQRLEELRKCLLLDGLKYENGRLIKLDPFSEGDNELSDELTNLLEGSHLDLDDTRSSFKNSESDFLSTTPDYSGCLTNARIGLESLVKNIAVKEGFQLPETKVWGKAVSYLKQKDVLSKDEENSISSVYTLVSDGAHKHIGLSEEEFARFGRNLCLSMAYFVIKRYSNNH